MNARAMTLTILALLGGCDVFGGGGGDDDEPPKDGGRTGLTLEWKSRPEEIPTEDSRITRATFQLSNLRIIGDAGPLALGMVALEWARDVEPGDTIVPDAPSGLYSRCLFDLVAPNGGYAYEIAGTVEQNAMKVPFVIRDRSATAVSMSFSEMLAPGGRAEIEVDVRIDAMVGAVDFSQVPLQNGTLVVEDGSTQLAKVRLQLASAFDVED
jgi:hypothetical protein